MDDTPWIKASGSTDAESTVEVRRHDGMIELRNSADGENGKVLRYTDAEWDAFLDGARKGEFDDLV